MVARLRNCVQLLAAQKMQLYDTSVLYTYEASLNFKVYIFYLTCKTCFNFYTFSQVFSYVIDLILLLYFFYFQIKDILKPEIGLEILEQTQHRLEIEGT